MRFGANTRELSIISQTNQCRGRMGKPRLATSKPNGNNFPRSIEASRKAVPKHFNWRSRKA